MKRNLFAALTLSSFLEHLYHEAEGISPDTETTYTLVESDQYNPTSGTGTIDLYKLEINRNAAMDTDSTECYRSSNGVISDDGNWMVFQVSITGTDTRLGVVFILCI